MFNSNVFKFLFVSLLMCPMFGSAMEPRKDKKSIKNNSNQPKVVPPQVPSKQQPAIQNNNQKQIAPKKNLKPVFQVHNNSVLNVPQTNSVQSDEISKKSINSRNQLTVVTPHAPSNQQQPVNQNKNQKQAIQSNNQKDSAKIKSHVFESKVVEKVQLSQQHDVAEATIDQSGSIFSGSSGINNFFGMFAQQNVVEPQALSNQQRAVSQKKQQVIDNKVSSNLTHTDAYGKKIAEQPQNDPFLFEFEVEVLKKINSNDVEGLRSLLKGNPGKSIDLFPHCSCQEPLRQACLTNTPMLLVLDEHQKQVKEYQDSLFFLIEASRSEELLAFLNNYQGCVDFVHYAKGKTPLEYAVNLDAIEKVKILKERGALLDQGAHSQPLLIIALINENKKMIKYLTKFNNYNHLDRDGIDITFRDSQFFWPSIHSGIEISQGMLGELYKIFDQSMYKFCGPQDELSKAASIGRPALINRALSKGAQIDSYDTNNALALNFACSNARIGAIGHLIDLGADVNLQDKKKGRSALHWVVRMHKKAKQKGARYMTSSELLPCSFLLMCAGAEPEVKNKEGKSVWYWVEKLDVDNEIKRLLRRILNIPQLNRKQREALLGDIYDFQVTELDEYISCENISAPSNYGERYFWYRYGERYFWHRPECRRMKSAWVRKNNTENDQQGTLPDFKDIYKKALK